MGGSSLKKSMFFKKRTFLIIGILAFFGIVNTYLSTASSYEVILTDITIEDGQHITEILEQNNISWKYDPELGTVEIEKDKVDFVRKEKLLATYMK